MKEEDRGVWAVLMRHSGVAMGTIRLPCWAWFWIIGTPMWNEQIHTVLHKTIWKEQCWGILVTSCLVYVSASALILALQRRENNDVRYSDNWIDWVITNDYPLFVNHTQKHTTTTSLPSVCASSRLYIIFEPTTSMKFPAWWRSRLTVRYITKGKTRALDGVLTYEKVS